MVNFRGHAKANLRSLVSFGRITEWAKPKVARFLESFFEIRNSIRKSRVESRKSLEYRISKLEALSSKLDEAEIQINKPKIESLT